MGQVKCQNSKECHLLHNQNGNDDDVDDDDEDDDDDDNDDYAFYDDDDDLTSLSQGERGERLLQFEPRSLLPMMPLSRTFPC